MKSWLAFITTIPVQILAFTIILLPMVIYLTGYSIYGYLHRVKTRIPILILCSILIAAINSGYINFPIFGSESLPIGFLGGMGFYLIAEPIIISES